MPNSTKNQGSHPILYSDLVKIQQDKELQRQIDEYLANGGKIHPWGEQAQEKTYAQTIKAVKKILADTGKISYDNYESLNPSSGVTLAWCISTIRNQTGWKIVRHVSGYKLSGAV